MTRYITRKVKKDKNIFFVILKGEHMEIVEKNIYRDYQTGTPYFENDGIIIFLDFTSLSEKDRLKINIP